MTRGAFFRATLATLALLALAPACAKQASPVAPTANVPPAITSLFPAPRSTGVAYDTPVYAQFDRALDPESVDTTTVYLKIDTRRVAIAVEYLRVVNRIQITPRAVLDLNKTYTVELSPRLKTPEGDSLGVKVQWQFSTNSLRRLTYSRPPSGSREGPHTMLAWTGNGGPTNNIVYEVFASTDSAAVANRTAPMLQSAVYENYLPRQSWTPGTRTYWAVNSVNVATGERLLDKVGSFDVYPVDAPTDTLIIPLTDFGGAGSNNRVQYCTGATLPTGSGYNSGIRWGLAGDRPNLRVASATITMIANSSSAADAASANTQLWYAQNSWSSCAFTFNGAPYTETNGYLATASVSALRATFSSAALSAFVEAAARMPGWNGFLLRGTLNVVWDVNASGVPQPQLKVAYYR